MSDKLLSVVVPVYNVEPYISRCLDSIISQSYRELEIICVNDGSTDDSVSLIKKYQKKDSRIRIINKKNGGLVSARKVGLLESTGEYVAYVDADDFVEQDIYMYLMDVIVKNNVDFVTSGIYRDYGDRIVSEKDKVPEGKYSGKKLIDLKEDLIKTDRFFERNISSHLVNKVFLKRVLKKYQMEVPDEITIGEDMAVFYPMVLDVNSIFVTDRIFYHYCLRRDSIMGSTILGEKDPVYLMLEYLRCQVLEKNVVGKCFARQYDFLSLYTCLLRDPLNTMRYENGELYPFGKVLKDERILLFGAGKFGIAVKFFLDKYGFKKVIWTDTIVQREDIVPFEDAKKRDYDKVLISVLIYDTQQDIKRRIVGEGIDEEKILSVKV